LPSELPNGSTVVIVGAGAVGLECAIELGKDGKKVTVLEMAATHGLGADMSGLGGGDKILEWCDEYGVDIKYNAKLSKINAATVEFSVNGEKFELPADTVLLAAGMTPQLDAARAFRSAAPNTEFYIVGDCRDAGDIRDATRSAFDICREI
jgi:NADPH-dependent 2,4-dienoyl-CoA reductase/sulfur reductase-like enzyme